MQNAWRFVDDSALRERLKAAKGIGTPATRAEIIGGLKKQAFLTLDGKNIVPTDIGLSLFDVLSRADPALVDPGVTARLECLLDDVVLGKQPMIGAIDAVCEVAQRIIDKLTAGGATLPPGGAAGSPPTPAMKAYADSLARQKKIEPPPGYEVSSAVCRAFLNEHAARKPSSARAVVAAGEADRGRTATKTKASTGKRRLKAASGLAPKTKAGRRGSLERPTEPASTTPLKIPYGNKETAMKLGARYGPTGWYAPPGVDLSGFRERGWN